METKSLVLLFCAFLSIADTFSNLGNEFYLAISKNFQWPDNIHLIVSTDAESSTIVPFTVENFTHVIYSGNTTSNSPSTVYLSPSLQVLTSSYSERQKGIRVYSEDGSLLSVIVVNSRIYTTGEYIAYPCLQLPIQQYTYYVVSSSTSTTGDSQALLVGCKDNTVITVIPSVDIVLPLDIQNAFSENIVVTAGTSRVFPLHQLQTLLFTSANLFEDLTGTQVISDEPLTLISGHECGNVPTFACCCEHFTEQIPPTSTWGTTFLLLPYSGKTADTYFKIVASQAETVAILACNEAHIQSSFSLKAGGYVEFTIGYKQYCSLVSNNQVLVAQFGPGGNLDIDELGDVVISIIPPIEQYPNKITASLLTDIPGVQGHYINVVATSTETVYLDEQPLSGWQPIYDNSSKILGYGVQRQVDSNTTHTIYHSDSNKGVGVLVYGFGPYTGYSYTGGITFKNLKPDRLVISPWYGHIFGGATILVSGPLFKEEDVIHCMFGGVEVQGVYISEQYATCVSPRLFRTTGIPFMLKINGVIYEYDAVFYPLSLEDSGDVEIMSDTLLFRQGDTISITWDPKDIPKSVGTVVEIEDLLVDIKLIEIDPNTNLLRKIAVLATDVPNSGLATIAIEGLDLTDTALCQVSLFIEAKPTTTQLRKRAINIFSLITKAGLWSRIFYITLSGIGRYLCNQWASTEPISVGQNILDRVRREFPCPPTFSQAQTENSNLQKDNRWIQFFHPEASNCFRQRDGTEERTGGYGNQCCYDENEDLIVGPGSGGTVDKIAPSLNTLGHLREDVIPYILCCKGLFKDCEKYYERRPSDDGTAYRPPIPAFWFGDPHVVTLDLHKYTFNGKGEFVLIETLDNSFTVQGRMIEATDNIGRGVLATVFSAIVAKQDDSDTVQIELYYGQLIALVNGRRIDFDTLKKQMFQNVSVSDLGNSTLAISFSQGEYIKVVEENGILSVVLLSLPRSFTGKTRGLMGSFDDDSSNDLTPKGENVSLPLNATIQMIHEKFGITWIINNSTDSLFTYLTGQDWSTFFSPEFIPSYELIFNDSFIEADASNLCGDDKFCLFDVAATGRLDIGKSTLQGGLNFLTLLELSKQIVCDPPCAYGACVANDTCTCSEGYEGRLCDTIVYSECDENVCENGGACKFHAGSHICECSSGYTGEYCENASKCKLLNDSGPCHARGRRYYYNNISKECETFLWGGCGGNDNRFLFQHTCEEECSECPPTCSPEFCVTKRTAICTIFKNATNISCPGGCVVSNCLACVYHDKPLPPVNSSSCLAMCTKPRDKDMKSWGRCLRRCFNSETGDIPVQKTKENYKCWEYPCLE